MAGAGPRLRAVSGQRAHLIRPAKATAGGTQKLLNIGALSHSINYSLQQLLILRTKLSIS